MEKVKFFKEIQEILLLDNIDVNADTEFDMDSMSSLLLIAFLDENFSKSITEKEIKRISKVSDIIEIVGENNLL